MSEENRFIKNKKIFALSMSLVVACILAGVLGVSVILTTDRNNELSEDYDDLYIDYLELLYDFNVLDEKYFNLTGEYSELGNDYNDLLDEYDVLLGSYDNLTELFNDLMVNYNNLNDTLIALQIAYDTLQIAYDDLLNIYETLLAGLTLIEIETLCNADTYISDMESETNFGNEQYWKVGADDYTWEHFIAFFNFSLLEKPEIYEKVEIRLHFTTFYPESIWYPIKFFQDWDENTLTYNNTPPIDPIYIPFSIHYDTIMYYMNMIIDVTDWVNTCIDSISIVVGGADYAVGYSREHPNQDLVPKLVWTVINISI